MNGKDWRIPLTQNLDWIAMECVSRLSQAKIACILLTCETMSKALKIE